ncbi:MAG: class B sortase [Candidatus Gastranaerophilales bacterium]|nr:class B sortase [Candidatus Gastranaerophilales bacterium]
MKFKTWEIIVTGALSVAGIAAVVALCSILLEYAGGSSVYKELESYIILPDEQGAALVNAGTGAGQESNPNPGTTDASGTNGTNQGQGAEAVGTVYYGQSPQVDFASLRERNSDVVGWIYGPGTAINYPVVQGDDNAYYLTHMFDGQENKCGSIFMDSFSQADVSSTNSILHGHHMRNGSMFASLTKYESQSYYDSHPVLWFVTPEKSYYVELFTGFVTDVNSDVWQVEFATKEDYQSWLDKMVGNTLFESGVTPSAEDHILTLATCSYKYDDARFVVMGILREANTL